MLDGNRKIFDKVSIVARQSYILPYNFMKTKKIIRNIWKVLIIFVALSTVLSLVAVGIF